METEEIQPESSSVSTTGPPKDNNIPEDDDLTQFEENPEPSMQMETNSESMKESEPSVQNGEQISEPTETADDTPMEQDSESVEIPESSELINSEDLSEALDLEENSGEANLEEENSEVTNLGEENSEAFVENSEESPVNKLMEFPLAKIKRIMKIGLGDDSFVKLVSKEAAYLVGHATELFVAAIAQEAAKITHSNKKKTMTMQHLITTIKESENFAFLEGTMVPDYDF